MSGIDSREEKDQEIIKISAQFIHDITTPLTIVQILATTLDNHLPALLSAYQQLKKQGIEVSDIPPEEYAAIENAALKIKNLSQKVNHAAKDYWQALNQQLEPASDNNIEQIAKPAAPISLENSLHILVAEDDAIHQKIALKVLSNLHKIDIAANGLEAVEYCRKKSYDLILMDLNMPVMDGYQAVAKIIKFKPTPPVIVGLTSRPLGSEKQQLLQSGFNGFIEKPLNSGALTKLIEEFYLTHK